MTGNFLNMSIYLDNAATTFPKPEEVYRAQEQVFRRIGVAPGRGGHRLSVEASRIVFETREAIAALFGVTDSSRIIFTHSATEALNLAVKGVVRAGDHVVTTTMEHNALARPLHRAQNEGVDVTWVEADLDGYVTKESIAAALRPETRLVAVTHCSNVTGAVNPVEEIGALLADRGVLFLVDGAQTAGSIPLNIEEANIDLFAAPGHKGLYGPPGTGFLYISPDIDLEPLLVGGTGGGSSDLYQPASAPERYESGTMNTPAIAGLKAGVDFVAEKGVAAIHEYEQYLVTLLCDGLTSINGVMVYNGLGRKPRGGVVSFTSAGLDPANIGFKLDHQYGISVRVGLHCAPLAHRTIGTFPEGTVRVSPGIFNTEDDIARFLLSVRNIVG
jgi:cysteine desulfurase family protein